MVSDARKTKAQLIAEVQALRAELAGSSAQDTGATSLDEVSDNYLYRTLAEVSPDAIMLLDLDGQLRWANTQAAELMGYDDVDDLLTGAPHLTSLAAPESLQHTKSDVERVMQEGSVRRVERSAQRKDGSVFPVEISASLVRSEANEMLGLTLVVRDLAECRQTEQRYRTLVETSPEGIALLDLEGNFFTANAEIARLQGYESAEAFLAAKLNCADLVVEDQRENARTRFVQLTQNGTLDQGEWTLAHPGGGRVQVELPAALVRDDRGAPQAVIAVARDITERKQIEAALAERNAALTRANEELQRLHRAKDEFIATVSHELRTPLVTGLGYIELLLEGLLGPINQDTEVKMGVALKNLKRLSRLIDDILDYQRLIRSDLRKPPEPAAIDLAELLREGLAEFVVRSGRSMTTTRCDLADDLPLVRADKDMLRRVVANLLDNADRHAGASASITLAAKMDSDRVRVSVVDDGVGMPPEVRDKAFEPFVRASPDASGSGLGLAIVREILEAHGASASLQSEPGRGTAASFTLQTARADETDDAANPVRIRHERIHAAGARILVVDDDADMLDFMNLALTQRGYRVQLASSAEQALAYLDRATADLVLLDISLPGLNGDELCRRLKSQPSTSNIPVAMFTAYAEKSTRLRAEAAGCDRYLVKPVMLSDLLTSLHELLVK